MPADYTYGSGLRLPYGKRTNVTSVDRLNIIAHDKFQEIIDEANKPDSAIRLQQVVINSEEMGKTITVVSQSQLATKLGLQPTQAVTTSKQIAVTSEPPVFRTIEEQQVAQITYNVIRTLENQPQKLRSIRFLQKPDVQAEVIKEVRAQYRPAQIELEGMSKQPDIAAIVAKASELVIEQTIDIPRILVVPKGNMQYGFRSFTLDLSTLNYPTPSDELWIQYLRTNKLDVIGLSKANVEETRLEDYVVNSLADFDDVAYDDHAGLLYDLAGQAVQHCQKLFIRR